jgi:serine/threonine-protein kinase
MRPGWGLQLFRFKLIEVPTDVERFQARIRSLIDVLPSVRTTGCARIIEAGTTPAGLPFVVGDYVPGPSLLDYVANRRPALSDRSQLAGRLCGVVADLHRHGIAHGALKSGNVVVTESDDGPSATLLDVGVVPAMEAGEALGDDRWIAADTRALHGLVGELLGDLASLVGGTESPAMLAATFVHPTG